MQNPDFTGLQKIHEGADAILYRARRATTGQGVVLKVLRGPHPAPEIIARFEREYRVVSALKAPGIIRAYDLESWDDTLVIVFEDFGGQSLADAIRATSLPLESFLTLAAQIAGALAYVHQNGITHKDINPANIIWNATTGAVKLIDFGAATTVPREIVDARNTADLEGTLPYIAPEQTGRMNRALDYRADFYSLGATFYEMLAKRPPFVSDDALELVHSHIAREPTPLSKLNQSVPEVVSDIVAKLLSKTAEERYQSAFGIKADLERCQEQLAHGDSVVPFELGQNDVVERLQIPEKLYGREQEVATLIEAFERVARGSFEIVMVSGYAGVGKTTVVREVQKSLVAKRGYFISGKVEPYKRGIPYAALIQAFEHFIRHILAEGEDSLKAWKRVLLDATEPMTQILIDSLPETELIVGPQPSVQELPPAEAENRLHLLFRRFVRCLATAERPIVLFLDNLQWTDLASIRLLAALASDPETRHLLLIGAYRDNEVSPTHPLMLALEAARDAGRTIHAISLEPLNQENVRQLVADAQRRKPHEVSPLANLCFQKTQGNPFFLNQFLGSLYDSGLLRFDLKRGSWQWDIARIEAQGFTDNVVDFMTKKLGGLAPASRECLAVAACIGSEFNLGTLALVRDVPSATAEADLHEAFELGLVQRIDRPSTGVHVGGEPVQYMFSHDRVQQASVALLDDDKRREIHLDVGRRLKQQATGADREERVFELANHLNEGAALIESRDEKDQLVDLNLQAGIRAKQASAYQPALGYFLAGLKLAGDDAWERLYPRMLELSVHAAESAFLSGDYEEMDSRINAVLDRGKALMDKVRAHEVRIHALNAQNDVLGAVSKSLQVLELLGVRIPAEPEPATLAAALADTARALSDKTTVEIQALPEAQDPEVVAAMRLLADSMAPAYFAAPGLLPLLACELVGLSVRHGISAESSYGFAVYAIVLCSTGALDAGYEMGKLALRLAERFEDRLYRNMADHIFNTHIRFWKESYRESLPNLKNVYQVALDHGDLKYAGFGASQYCYYGLQAGRPLNQLLVDIENYGDAIEKMKQVTSVRLHAITHQSVLNLLGHSPDPIHMGGPAYDEDEMLPVHQELNDRTNIAVLFCAKTMLGCYFRQPELAVRFADMNMEYLDAAPSSLNASLFDFHAALAYLSLCDERPSNDQDERARLLEKVSGFRANIDRHAGHAPMNHSHRLSLVDAEKARVEGDTAKATASYDLAIKGARASGYIQEEALANELAARCYHALGNETVTRAYLLEARYAYQRWGAQAKLAQLDAEFRELIPHIGSHERAWIQDGGSASESFDLQTVLKASQAISGEIVLDKLLRQIMLMVIENAGAERGLLVLHADEGARVEAEAWAEGPRVVTDQKIAVDESKELSPGLVHYVMRSGETVVLADASHEGDFVGEDYVRRVRPRSLLCSPILHRGEVIGALYLENNLSPGVFTPERLEVLTLLSAQAAISISNARLYDELEEKVALRTQELELRNRFITATFGRYLASDVVESLLANPDALEMGGEKRKVTIIMADMRGFTSMAERLPPEQVVSTVNSFLSAMTDVILRYDGTVDAFLGDAVQAVFGVPLWRPSDAERAIACAVSMQLAMAEVNESNVKHGLPKVEMGIGINTEEVVVGNIGSEKRAKYGVVGGGVALAVRIESYSVGGQILIAEATRHDVGAELRIDSQLQVDPKGITDPITIYEVGGIGGKYGLYLPEPTSELEELVEGVEIAYAILEGKAVASAEHQGWLARLSKTRLEVESRTPVEPLTNLKIWIRDTVGSKLTEAVYGKVVRRDGDRFAVHLTAVPDAARDALDAYPRKS